MTLAVDWDVKHHFIQTNNFRVFDWEGRHLTHLSLTSLLWDIGKQNSPRCDAAILAPDVMPQIAASHLGLFCLLAREFSSKN